MNITVADKEILRRLAGEYAEAAGLPVHKEKAELWRRKNRLVPVRPLVYMDEIPWHEMNVDDELTLRCADEYCRQVERDLRMRLYQWRHMPCDMVLDPVLNVGVVCSPQHMWGADYGIKENATHPEHGGSASYAPGIKCMADVEKMRTPEVTVDWEETERRFQVMREVCDGIIGVEKRGITHEWMAPWDMIIRWYGIEQLYTDMVDEPELVHAIIGRFMKASHEMLDRKIELGLLAAGTNNQRVGSGGLGITDELPGADFDPLHVRPLDQWGTSTGQIFSEVSPDMHDEFCLQYEQPYLERFGLSCYGCCEPLHNKMGILRKVKNLRRVSMSYWINIDKAAQEVRDEYIFSYKPTPAVFASESWDIEPARANLREVLEKTRGCHVELILKDISTVRNDPRRLWEWAGMAVEMAEECG